MAGCHGLGVFDVAVSSDREMTHILVKTDSQRSKASVFTGIPSVDGFGPVSTIGPGQVPDCSQGRQGHFPLIETRCRLIREREIQSSTAMSKTPSPWHPSPMPHASSTSLFIDYSKERIAPDAGESGGVGPRTLFDMRYHLLPETVAARPPHEDDHRVSVRDNDFETVFRKI